MIHFLQIAIQKKASDDFRAFLDWADSDEMMVYQLRGYGSTPGQAADDAYAKYADEDFRDSQVTDCWEWV
jgi:hypothetical protein